MERPHRGLRAPFRAIKRRLREVGDGTSFNRDADRELRRWR